MTGPDHYREAERLERQAVEEWNKGAANTATMMTLPRAQVHATLALAAATATLNYNPTLSNANSWNEALTS